MSDDSIDVRYIRGFDMAEICKCTCKETYGNCDHYLNGRCTYNVLLICVPINKCGCGRGNTYNKCEHHVTKDKDGDRKQCIYVPKESDKHAD